MQHVTKDENSAKPQNLLHLSKRQIEELLASWGEPSFRAQQVYEWLWKHGARKIEDMTNVSKNLRARLLENYYLAWPKVIKTQLSSDGTEKFLFQLEDGKSVETVAIPREDQGRMTVCISTQVGCRMGCTFCMTAQQKTERNLSAGEIAAQLRELPSRDRITNVVVMGMGEPFDNYENLMGALDIATDPNALGLGTSKITVSTSGLVPAIRKFAQESKCRLAISLNAPNDKVRSEIMPVNKAYNLDRLLGTVREICSDSFPRARRKNYYVTFEYILMAGINDRSEDARELLNILRGIPHKINLLLYNETPNTPYKRPTPERVAEFQSILTRSGVLNFVRKSRGRDISAACGQLASESKRQAVDAAASLQV